MSSTTPRVSLYKPAGGENVNVTTDINNNLDKIDTNLSFRVVANAAGRNAISPFWAGLNVRQTDDGTCWVSNGSAPISASWDQFHTANTWNSVLNLSTASTANTVFKSRVGTEANNRFEVRGDGKNWWGPGGATAVDVNLYRGGTNQLKTDDDFVVAGSFTASTNATVSGSASIGGAVTVGGNLTGSGTIRGSDLTDWIAYTPTWTGLSNMGTGFSSTGRYCRVGNTVHCVAQLTAGTSPSLGTGNIFVTLPITPSSAPSGNIKWIGTGRHADNNGGSWKTLVLYVTPGGNPAQVFGIRQTDLAWVSPGTAGNVWVAGSTMNVEVTYEV